MTKKESTMHNRLIFLLLLSITGTLHPLFSRPPSLTETTFEINQKFTIRSQVEIPVNHPQDFQWKDEDDWQLTSYPTHAIKLIKTTATAPDYVGGNLLQSWTLKGRVAGTYTLTFQRYNEQKTLNVTILPTVMDPVWIDPWKSAHGQCYINLENGDEHYLLPLNEKIKCIAPLQTAQDTAYVWKQEDRWTVSLPNDASIEIVDAYDKVWKPEEWHYASSLNQHWTLQIKKAGVHTVTFKHHAETVTIMIKTSD